MFLDQAEIYVRGGDGGNGCVSFRREKYVPKGGPDGGDGGDGGHVYIEAVPGLSTLVELAGHHHWIAENGRPGSGKKKAGRSAPDIVIRVPAGTLVFDRDSGAMLKDLREAGMRVRVARGGRGGQGNAAFATPTNQAPREAEAGRPGAERWLRLELKLIADVGIIGRPNAGKSTLLSRMSRARPKIADYPFTTLTPQLGIVELSGFRRFVMVDIPGLIEGAHEGVGLGDAFLRHVERTRILLHLVDLFPPEGEPSPAEAYRQIRHELEKFSPALASKPELIVANKLDLEPDTDALARLSEALGREVLGISAVAGKGLDTLTNRLWDMLQQAPAAPEFVEEPLVEPQESAAIRVGDGASGSALMEFESMDDEGRPYDANP